MTVLTGFFTHFKVLKRLAVESSFVERSESVESLVVFLFISLFVEMNGFCDVFIDHCSLLMQDA